MKKVFCIGELLIDFVAEKKEGNLKSSALFAKKAGGAPANVACAIAKLGGHSSFIGCVGEDQFGSFLLNVLKQNHVDVFLSQRSTTFTTLAFVSIDENGERDFVFSRGADMCLKYNSAIKKDFKNNMVHLGAATAMLGGELEDAYNRYFFDALTQNAFISFDPNYRFDLWKENENVFIKKCMPFIAKSHLCKFSLEEAELLSGLKNLNEIATFFHDEGTPIVCITLGEKGTFISTLYFKKTIPSISIKPVDTTGAGDAFIGCLLYQIAKLDKLETLYEDEDLFTKMIAIANKAGAITATNYGAIPSLPEASELF